VPASKHRDVQTDKTDGGQFITIPVGSNGSVAYRKVYLRTLDKVVARRRARVLADVQDVDEARRIIKYLAESRSPEEERRRIARVARIGPLVPSLDMDEARRELESIVCDFGDWVPGQIPEDIVEKWQATGVAEEQREILLELGVPADFLAENPGIFTSLATRGWRANPDHRPRREALEALFKLGNAKLAKDRPARRGRRLSDCIAEFRTEQEQRANQPRHTSSYIHRFEEFVKLLKDPLIADLEKADFVRFVDHVLAEKKGLTNKTINDHLQAVKAVIQSAQARLNDDAFPEGLNNWLRLFDRERRKRPYKSPRHNRQPMPPDVFKTLLAQADRWAELDCEAYAASLPLPDEKDRRKQAHAIRRHHDAARHRKRVGMMTHSMLCLAANVGAGATDFSNLLWSELRLDGDLPLYQEDRGKPAHLLGSDVPRCCPLLPETVRSLKRWREWQQVELRAAAERRAKRAAARAKRVAQRSGNASADQPPERGGKSEPSTPVAAGAKAAPIAPENVFTYADGRRLDQTTSMQATDYLRYLRRAVGDKVPQLRSCRNIGATLCRGARLPTDMAEAWLGHSARGTNKFYTGEAEEDYLLPLVRVIGEKYLPSYILRDPTTST